MRNDFTAGRENHIQIMPLDSAVSPLRRHVLLSTCRCFCVLGFWLLSRVVVAQDLTSVPFEQLLETEVVDAARFSQQLTDTPSAVSVITAQDIRRFGYRTLAEIMNNMRGLNIGFDGAYYFPGGRGYGQPGEYAGRVMLRIDGQPVADNVFNQIYLGEDGLLDTELIDRVEYAPGPGAALYGNNAFLGVINVVTLRGRDLNGTQVAMTTGSNQDRKVRASWGKRLDNGAEWLVSASSSQADLPRTHLDDGILQDDLDGQRLFIKGAQGAWSIEGVFAERNQQELSTPLGSAWNFSDTNTLWKLGHDADHGSFRSSVRLAQGSYQYSSAYREPIEDGRRFIENIDADGRWWDLEGTISSIALTGHRVVLGGEYRDDYLQDQQMRRYFPRRNEYELSRSHGEAQTASLFAQDEIELPYDLSLNLGLRFDRRSSNDTVVRSAPRAALLYTGLSDTTLSLSHGVATRFASRNETTFYELSSTESERVTTTEFVSDYRRGDFRVLGSLYRYRITDPIRRFSDPALAWVDTRGAELEAQWQWHGVQLRGSHTWQRSQDNLARNLINSPRNLSKLQISVPLAGERLRASLAARYVGERLIAPGRNVAGYAITDLTLTSEEILPGVSVTAAVRNLFDRHYLESPFGAEIERGERTLWFSLGYAFQ
ncbi:iron complex outermembrane recepter protein [Pseudomonas sp. NFACC23-1]|uniref:TonB-dependent receptor plug domain-containing protein n=1 Tax=unclassified Pseudomonas TaxID=196821 RepID=UPI00088323AA|nr:MULTISPECIES: TonB-dependent receptor [unclassified Pseudomonas]SDB11408.1 iron complex outermembrane recepter protein [Pseudomonas sp. NFACC17-2]SEI89318.1 iron complex outermembrane recepter protein [Pseudomonas sp. NFACC23-1]SFW16599.1 iron complex outermembrane recepter protein [Pseudomonas sp. NFACC16-2]